MGFQQYYSLSICQRQRTVRYEKSGDTDQLGSYQYTAGESCRLRSTSPPLSSTTTVRHATPAIMIDGIDGVDRIKTVVL